MLQGGRRAKPWAAAAATWWPAAQSRPLTEREIVAVRGGEGGREGGGGEGGKAGGGRGQLRWRLAGNLKISVNKLRYQLDIRNRNV